MVVVWWWCGGGVVVVCLIVRVVPIDLIMLFVCVWSICL